MDYYQSVVAEFLKADRACFINPEFWLRGNVDRAKQYAKPHWYVDILAVHLRLKRVFLCEVTYAKKAPSLILRLTAWRDHWETILETLREDACLDPSWPVQPWIFAPQSVLDSIRPTITQLHQSIKFKALEEVVPWNYKTWDHHHEEPPELIMHS